MSTTITAVWAVSMSIGAGFARIVTVRGAIAGSNEKEISRAVGFRGKLIGLALQWGRWLHRLVRPGLAYAERVLLAICNQSKEVVLQQLLTPEKPLRLSKAYLERDAPLGRRPLTH